MKAVERIDLDTAIRPEEDVKQSRRQHGTARKLARREQVEKRDHSCKDRCRETRVEKPVLLLNSHHPVKNRPRRVEKVEGQNNRQPEDPQPDTGHEISPYPGEARHAQFSQERLGGFLH